jgi:hypothetical protein
VAGPLLLLLAGLSASEHARTSCDCKTKIIEVEIVLDEDQACSCGRRRWTRATSCQGPTVGDITSLSQFSEDYVRDVIHAFNDRG